MTLLLWLLIGLPWVFVPWTVSPFLHPKEAVFQVGTLLVLAWTHFRPTAPTRLWRNPWAKWVLVYVVASFAWRFWATFILSHPDAEGDILFKWYTVRPTFNILLGFLLVHALVTQHFTRFAFVHQFLQALCVSVAALSAYSLFQFLGIDPLFRGEGRTNILSWAATRFDHRLMVGMFGNPADCASFFAVHLPLFLVFKERRYLAFLAVALLAVACSQVSYAWLASGAGLAVYGGCRLAASWHPTRLLRWGLAAGLAVAAAGCVQPAFDRMQTDERWPIWRHVLAHATLQGHGAGSFAVQYKHQWDAVAKELPDANPTVRWAYAHNEPLQALYEFGVAGVALALGLFGWALRQAWRKRRTVLGAAWLGCGAAYAVVSGMHVTWHMAPMALTGLVIWALWETEEATV